MLKHWVIERSFAWLRKCGWLWKNSEHKLNTSLQFFHVASGYFPHMGATLRIIAYNIMPARHCQGPARPLSLIAQLGYACTYVSRPEYSGLKIEAVPIAGKGS
jgi:hypothetical protein